MYSSILRIFDIKRSEAGFIFLLFISAGFLGIFLSTFDIAAHAIFLDKFHQKDLALTYLFSGGLGVVVFFVYAQVFKRLSIKTFNFINLSIILGSSIVYFYFFMFRNNLWSTFLGLVVMFPVNLLALLNFWRYVRRQLHPEQSKRLYPIIETGFILGLVAGSYGVIGALLIYDYFIIPIITVSSILILFLLQFLLNGIHKRSDVFNHRRDKFIPVRSSYFLLFTSKYTLYLFLFTLVSSIIGFLIHFGFINLTRTSFPHIIGMSKFYGLFIGSMFLFILAVDRFLIRKILYSYDSPYSIVLLPVAVAAILAVTLIFNMTVGNSVAVVFRFTFLFILMVMNKVIYESTKYTIQIPSVRTLFRTLDARFLQVIYPRIEGTIVMLGLLIAGLIIIVVLNTKIITFFFTILLISFILCVLWFFFAIKLIKLYKSALQDSYKKMKIGRSLELRHESYNEKIRKILVGLDPVRVINALKLSAKIEPLTYENSLRRMLAHPDPIIQEYILSCIRSESLLDLLPELKQIKPGSEKSEIELKSTIAEFEKKISVLNAGNRLEEMVNSPSMKERILASEMIGSRKDLSYTSALINLSREFEPDVKKAAVKAMSRISSSEHSYILIELLNSPQFHAYAFETLVQIGEPVLDHLEQLFLDPGTDDNILARVVRIYGKIGTQKSVDLLLTKTDNQSRRVVMHAIAALREANFQANTLNSNRILNSIVKVIHTIGWNMLIYTSLAKNKSYIELRIAYGKEIETNYDLLYDLLSLAYNPRTIREIREYLDEGSQADVSHAIELLDHFIYEDIKPILFPIIENISQAEVVKKLQYYFPIESMTCEEIISATLTRDYNLLSLYPRICAMLLIHDMPGLEVNNELIANLFHPNQLLREVAALVIYKKDPVLFASVTKRLELQVMGEIATAISKIDIADEFLLLDKFNLLRMTQKLSQLEEEILINMSHSLVVTKYEAGQSFDLSLKHDEYALFIIVAGKVKFNDIDEIPVKGGMYELYYANILVNFGISKINFPEGGTLLGISGEAVENLLFDYTEMANCVLSCVEQFKIAG